ncbi:ABC transporter substrate-binding protein [Paenibacillus larvae]|nr:ABC transporter substrate-binding protein [Paenibacillus larvae]MCY7476381.1 ABC transporter substrate-binding protein [Paenibacillus larvae]MCY7491431.1 ABC transporter substrate-binding protein [Paenibacillus larvae]MCY9709965.1 ABC transporter substrate-binding protein [Paenibacillus larvae]MDE5128145.1 ABC transporter substrate-binding protein [Paenibacillus larvae subsp. larvae]MDE5134368.1 ABC transporter substrate-binding protein [Paenibacillus larvae subsp. larvae]
MEIITRAPTDTLVAMKQKEVDATLIPEPWGTQMENKGVGTILLDWDKIPPHNGDYPLTILVASDDFLNNHKEMAKQAVEANIEAIEFIKQNPDKSYELINNQLKKLSGKGLEQDLIKAAISRLHLTPDVSKNVLEEMAQVSIENGFIKNVKPAELDLSKFIDTSLLEEVKKEKK